MSTSNEIPFVNYFSPTPRVPRKPIRWWKIGASLLLHTILTLLAMASVLPFFWLICATFKNNADFFNYSFLPWSQPRRWTGENYYWLFAHWPYARWLCNSLFLASAQTVLIV